MAGGQLPFGFAPQGELTSYTPTLREKAADWLRQKLFTDDRAGQDKANRLVNWGETMLPPFGFATSAYDAGRAGGEGDYATAGMIGAMAMLPGAAGKGKGIRAFHGSPHSFDKFSMDKIGTGEGAQAYGHGLYFAENEGVAKGYQTNNSATAKLRYNGHPITDDATHSVAWYLEQSGGDKTAVLDKWRSMYKPSYWETASGKQDLKILKQMDPAKIKAGNMYEVNIDADPNAFLDWDKPLSEQPEVMAKLKPLLYDPAVNQDFVPRYTGKDIMSMDGPLSNYIGKTRTPGDYRGVLKSEGIPGIKYLDAGSRGAGDGTRNYVVFDDKLVSIVRKYGIAGASAMLGYNLLDGLTDAQAAELKKAENN